MMDHKRLVPGARIRLRSGNVIMLMGALNEDAWACGYCDSGGTLVPKGVGDSNRLTMLELFLRRYCRVVPK